MRGKSQSGLTLIEILIAITLLSLLTTGVLIAMRLGMSTLERTDARMVRNRRVTSARRIVENEIEGYIQTTALFHPGPDSFRPVNFLQAEPASMRFVTAFSLQDGWRGKAQIAALQVIPGEREGVRLIVNETPFTGPAQAGLFVAGIEVNGDGRPVTRFAPIVPTPDSFVIADRLRSCRFSYLEKRLIPPFDFWQPSWILPQQLPAGVRIEMEPLDAPGAGLQPATITVRFNVNRTPGVQYAAQ